MKRKNALWIAAALVVAIGIGGYATLGKSKPAQQTELTPFQAQSVAEVVPAAGESAENPLKAQLADRSLGNPDAPVKVHEFASLTCTHCADFSKQTFEAFKVAYIDTGKVYFTYHDFPLNAPALDATMIARCLPENRYFQFVAFLFQSQDKWAFSKNYRKNLNQNVKLLGMSDQQFNDCLANQDLKKGIVDKVQEATKKYSIQSTPSFIIIDASNNVQTIKGAQPLENFSKVIDPLLTATGQ